MTIPATLQRKCEQAVMSLSRIHNDNKNRYRPVYYVKMEFLNTTHSINKAHVLPWQMLKPCIYFDGYNRKCNNRNVTYMANDIGLVIKKKKLHQIKTLRTLSKISIYYWWQCFLSELYWSNH